MASSRYSEGYLETAVAMAALCAEENGWPNVQDTPIEHVEDYLFYLQDRTRCFRERTCAEPWKLSNGHFIAQYRHLNRAFDRLVELGPNDENPILSISAPKLEEKTAPAITEDRTESALLTTIYGVACHLAMSIGHTPEKAHVLRSAKPIGIMPSDGFVRKEGLW